MNICYRAAVKLYGTKAAPLLYMEEIFVCIPLQSLTFKKNRLYMFLNFCYQRVYIYIWRRTEIKFLYEIFIIHYNWGDEMTSLYTLHLQKPSYLSRILHRNGWFKGTTSWNYFEIIGKWFVIMQVLYCLMSVAKYN